MVNVIHNPGVLSRCVITASENRRIASSYEGFEEITEIRVAYANEMTVHETSIWIWTLGYKYGWLDAQCYAESFQDNQIAGWMLPSVSLRMLEDIGIRNRNHCMEIMRAIALLFPRTNENHFRVQIGSGLGDQRQGSVVYMDEFMAASISEGTAGVFDYDMADDLKRRCLILTLRSEQKVPVGQKQHLKSEFAKFNYNVEIIPWNKENLYILVFDDREEALEAKAQANNLGYQLAKYRPRCAGPDNPVLFKVLSPVTVREGKSFKTKKVKMLAKNDIILVNKVKGGRARVISFQDGRRIGWVSLYGQQYQPLLERWLTYLLLKAVTNAEVIL